MSGGIVRGDVLGTNCPRENVPGERQGLKCPKGISRIKMSKGISGGIARRKFPDSHADSRVVVTVCETVVNTLTHTHAHTDSFDRL